MGFLFNSSLNSAEDQGRAHQRKYLIPLKFIRKAAYHVLRFVTLCLLLFVAQSARAQTCPKTTEDFQSPIGVVPISPGIFIDYTNCQLQPTSFTMQVICFPGSNISFQINVIDEFGQPCSAPH